MKKLIWCVKQLLPLTYITDYKEEGKHILTVWKMWLGRSFAIQNYELKD